MLKSVHGEVPRQSAPTMKEDLKKPALVELTEEQKQQMLLSEGFRNFFDKSARIVERALCESDGPSHEYSIGGIKTESYVLFLTSLPCQIARVIFAFLSIECVSYTADTLNLST
uniref:Dynein light chain n=1 Tax=Mesocestoides corti TaxID=53468 RepID=A0A5K3G5B1_MESCO